MTKEIHGKLKQYRTFFCFEWELLGDVCDTSEVLSEKSTSLENVQPFSHPLYFFQQSINSTFIQVLCPDLYHACDLGDSHSHVSQRVVARKIIIPSIAVRISRH